MTHKTKKRHAFTIVEMLMALTISALLLTAVAGAIHACFQSYTENERISDMTQTARGLLLRMGRELRTAKAVDYTSGLLTIIPPDGSANEQIEYELVSGELIYRLTVSGAETEYELISSSDEVQVTSFTMTSTMGKDWQNLDCVKTLTTAMTLSADGREFEVTSTTSPRRNLLY